MYRDAEAQDAPHQLACQANVNNDLAEEISQGIGSPAAITTTPSLHHQIKSDEEHVCQECSLQLPHMTALDKHAKQTQHGSYACNCGGTFSRLDVLRRHLQQFNPEEVYPCPYCTKHTGQRAFTRLDHLTQHLRGYHHFESSTESQDPGEPADHPARKSKTRLLFCPHKGCVYHHDAAASGQQPRSMNTPNVRPFRTQSDFTKHLREVHNASLYPCDVPGCDRTGRKGFFRRKSLATHKKGHRMDPHHAPV